MRNENRMRYFELKWREVGGDFFEQIYIAKDKEAALNNWREAWPEHIGIEYIQPIVTEVTKACYDSGQAYFKSGGTSPLLHHCATCGASHKKSYLIRSVGKLYCGDCIGEHHYDDWPCQ